MRHIVDPRTTIGQARLAGLAGVALTLIGLLLDRVVVWLLADYMIVPFDEQNAERVEGIINLHAPIALLALLVILLSRWPILSALTLLVSFIVSFVVAFGWYFLLTPSPLALAGLGGVLYLISAGLMVAAALMERPHREES